MFTTDLAECLTVEDIVNVRDESVRYFEESHRAYKLCQEKTKMLSSHGAGIFITRFPSVEEITKEIDRLTWNYIFKISGMKDLMNTQQKADFDKQNEENPPAVTVNAVKSTLTTLHSCCDDTFVEGLIHTFKSLDNSFKSNNPFRVGHKLVFKGAANGVGYWNHYSKGKDYLDDIERIIYVVNKQRPEQEGEVLSSKLYKYIGTTDKVTFKYFTCKTFKNGNVHLIIHCKHTINRLNDIIAQHYGQTLAA